MTMREAARKAKNFNHFCCLLDMPPTESMLAIYKSLKGEKI